MTSKPQLLGSGSHGIVEVVEHDGKRYARKSYRKHLSKEAIREITALSTLQHPNIIGLEKVVLTPDASEIVMELADETLENYVRKGIGLEKVCHPLSEAYSVFSGQLPRNTGISSGREYLNRVLQWTLSTDAL